MSAELSPVGPLVSIDVEQSAADPDGQGDVLDSILAAVLADLVAAAAGAVNPSTSAPDPAVLDCGGGSGRRAVPLARLGAQVTVIDSSIDALAMLARRAAEAGVADRVKAIQADLETLTDIVGSASVDLVLLHEVLDSTQDANAVLMAAAAAVRPGGSLSVVVLNPVAAVLARALSGDLDEALGEMTATSHPDAVQPDLATLDRLITGAGLEVVSRFGIGVFSALVPGTVLDGQPRSRSLLAELDRVGGGRSPYRDIAGHLHLLARRPASSGP